MFAAASNSSFYIIFRLVLASSSGFRVIFLSPARSSLSRTTLEDNAKHIGNSFLFPETYEIHEIWPIPHPEIPLFR